jgi:hypothetical protein
LQQRNSQNLDAWSEIQQLESKENASRAISTDASNQVWPLEMSWSDIKECQDETW